MSADDLDTLWARYQEIEAAFERGEISSSMRRNVCSNLQAKIEALGSSVLTLKQEALDRELERKINHAGRLFAVQWLSEPDMLDWLAREFDNAEGDTETCLKAALAALRVRVNEEAGL